MGKEENDNQIMEHLSTLGTLKNTHRFTGNNIQDSTFMGNELEFTNPYHPSLGPHSSSIIDQTMHHDGSIRNFNIGDSLYID